MLLFVSVPATPDAVIYAAHKCFVSIFDLQLVQDFDMQVQPMLHFCFDALSHIFADLDFRIEFHTAMCV